jgi:hypothetical protein
VELAETAEEGGFRGVPQPALADEGGAEEGGGEADVEKDLYEEVVVVEHLGYGRCRRRLPLALHFCGFGRTEGIEDGWLTKERANGSFSWALLLVVLFGLSECIRWL